MSKRKKRRRKHRDPFALPAKMRQGSGYHKDKRKEEERKKARKKVEEEE